MNNIANQLVSPVHVAALSLSVLLQVLVLCCLLFTGYLIWCMVAERIHARRVNARLRHRRLRFRMKKPAGQLPPNMWQSNRQKLAARTSSRHRTIIPVRFEADVAFAGSDSGQPIEELSGRSLPGKAWH